MDVSVTIEGCPVAYSVSESDFVHRVDAYVCVRVSDTCDELSFNESTSV
jgi:hypothetical protein